MPHSSRGARMMCTRAAWLLVVLLFGSAHPGECRAQRGNDAGTLEEIASALEARERQRNPIWVRYRVQEFYSAAFRKRFFRVLDPKDLRYEITGEYARKGVKTRSWGKTTDPALLTDWQREALFIFDGSSTVMKHLTEENSYSITKTNERRYAWVGPTFEVSGEGQVLGASQWWRSKSDEIATIKVDDSQRSGPEGTVTVELSYRATKWRNKCWFLPARGWALLRYEKYNKLGNLVERRETTEFGEVDGFVYAKRGKSEAEFEKGGKAGWIKEFEVTSIETRASKIPDSLFQIQFPKNAILWDADLKVPIRNTEVTQTHLDEVVSRISPPRTNWWLWGGLASTTLVVLGGGLFWMRRRGKRSPA